MVEEILFVLLHLQQCACISSKISVIESASFHICILRLIACKYLPMTNVDMNIPMLDIPTINLNATKEA